MPGDLAGSPMLTFAPLDRLEETQVPGSLGALMERRFEAYKAKVVEPFFREHFQRVDRQIVLVDVLSAVDAGPAALAELEEALDAVLLAFRVGRNSLLTRFFAPRADRILFAATKADHLHQSSHDRLDALLRLLVARAMRRTEAAGARVGTVALAPCAPPARPRCMTAARCCARSRGRLRPARPSATTPSTGSPRPRSFRRIAGGRAERARRRDPAGRVPLPALPPAFGPARRPRPAGHLPQIRLDRAMQFLIGDKLT